MGIYRRWCRLDLPYLICARVENILPVVNAIVAARRTPFNKEQHSGTWDKTRCFVGLICEFSNMFSRDHNPEYVEKLEVIGYELGCIEPFLTK